MENQLENVVQTAFGSRNVREGDYRGVKVIVVTGFDSSTDDWPFHVYIQQSEGARSRLSSMPTYWRSASLEGAFEEGARLAIQHLTPKVSTLPNVVKSVHDDTPSKVQPSGSGHKRGRSRQPTLQAPKREQAMADDKTKNAKPDRRKVAGGEKYEIAREAKKMGVKPGQIKPAIEQVGNSRAKVEKALAKRKGKGS
jgi:Protein of unknown function (DUF3606)